MADPSDVAHCGHCMNKIEGKTLQMAFACGKCRRKFHFGLCSGVSMTHWKKQGAAEKRAWECHICNIAKIRLAQVHIDFSLCPIGSPAYVAYIGYGGALPPDPAIKAAAEAAAAVATPRFTFPTTTTTSTPLTATLRNAEDDDTISEAERKRKKLDASGDFEAFSMESVPKFKNETERNDFLLKVLLDMSAHMGRMSADIRDIKAENVGMKSEVLALNSVIQDQARTIEKLQSKSDKLETKLKQSEDYSRSENLIVHGLPATKTGKEARGWISKLAKIAKIEVTDRDIVACHTLQLQKDKGANQKLICKFVNRWLKEDFKKAVNAARIKGRSLGLADEKQPVFAVDHLCPESNRLFNDVRQSLYSRKNGAYNFVWTTNCKIFIRLKEGSQAIQVTNYDQLQSLKTGQIEILKQLKEQKGDLQSPHMDTVENEN